MKPVILPLALVLLGCRSEDAHQNPIPDSFVVDADPALYAARAQVSWVSPMPFATAVGSQPSLQLDCYQWSLSATQVDQLVKANIAMVEVKSKSAVALSWTSNPTSPGDCTQRAIPAAPLAAGEYMLQIVPKGQLTLAPGASETRCFRTNSAPRVTRLTFLAVSAGKGPQLVIDFSETMKAATIAGALSLLDTVSGKSQTATYIADGDMVTSVAFELPGSLDLGHTTRVSINGAATAGTGMALDGKYVGTAGSGEFSIDLVPSQHADATTSWVPTLP